jgi:hypothetical protein
VRRLTGLTGDSYDGYTRARMLDIAESRQIRQPPLHEGEDNPSATSQTGKAPPPNPQAAPILATVTSHG